MDAMGLIQLIELIHFVGVLEGKNISAVAMWGERAAIVSDEKTKENGNFLQFFQREEGGFRAVPGGVISLDVPGQPVEEFDLEGLTVEGDTAYILGSHSARRKKIEPDKKYKKNRETLMGPVTVEPARDVLLRVTLDADGRAGPIERSSLRSFLEAQEPFKSMSTLAGKENGIDAEGLALKDAYLYVGFRGPVLRGNYAPVVRMKFGAAVEPHDILFLDLAGRGVRDLVSVGEGFLVLAGPVGDGQGSYQLYHWDGKDRVPGVGSPLPPDGKGLDLLGDLPMPTEGITPKAEGVALLKETAEHWELVVVFDGSAGGARYQVQKPRK